MTVMNYYIKHFRAFLGSVITVVLALLAIIAASSDMISRYCTAANPFFFGWQLFKNPFCYPVILFSYFVIGVLGSLFAFWIGSCLIDFFIWFFKSAFPRIITWLRKIHDPNNIYLFLGGIYKDEYTLKIWNFEWRHLFNKFTAIAGAGYDHNRELGDLIWRKVGNTNWFALKRFFGSEINFIKVDAEKNMFWIDSKNKNHLDTMRFLPGVYYFTIGVTYQISPNNRLANTFDPIFNRMFGVIVDYKGGNDLRMTINPIKPESPKEDKKKEYSLEEYEDENGTLNRHPKIGILINNNGKTDIVDCWAKLRSVRWVFPSGIFSTELVNRINPRHLNLSWSAATPKEFHTIKKDGGDGIIELIETGADAQPIFIFFGVKSDPYQVGSYKLEIEIHLGDNVEILEKTIESSIQKDDWFGLDGEILKDKKSYFYPYVRFK